MKSIMNLKKKSCEDWCYKPSGKRLALTGAADEFACYAESYVKCFWGLCDHHRSVDSFARSGGCEVITQQPVRQDMPIRPPGVIQSILVSH